MKRLFIDSDYIQKDEVNNAKRTLSYMFDDAGITLENQDIFDQVIGHAWHQPEPAWEAVKAADEIYANSALVPLCGYGSYTGSVVVFDVMMMKAIEEKISGKSIFFLRTEKKIEWEGINLKLLPKAFKKNKLFTLDEEGDKFVQVDIKALIKRFK